MTYPKRFPPTYRHAAKLIRSSVGLCIAGISLGSLATTAQAEGSRTLYPSGASGNRANLEWRTETYGGLVLRRTLLKVFANAGENILVGSSAMGVTNGTTTGDILIFNPGGVTGSIGSETVVPANANFKCSSQAAGNGKIVSRAQELAGPKALTGGGNPNGYTPCTYTAPTTGIYDVVIYGPWGFSATTDGTITGDISLAGANNFNDKQGSSIAAWDVTVRSNNTTSTIDLNGRLFSNYYALFNGINGRLLNFPIYPVTNDGFRYKVQLRNLDPNGFLIYGNQVGFWDSDGKTPLYHDIIGQDGQIASPTGGVSLARPQYATFVNPVDVTALSYIDTFDPNGIANGTGITINPVLPTVVSPPVFSGTVSGNTSLLGSGGTFTFSSSTGGNFQIVISRDGVNYDPTNINNRVLRGIMASSGAQSIAWNGKDNNGVAMPTGSNYPVKLTVQGGEYHFPLLDAENNFSGGPTFTLLNTSLAGKTTAYYDDRGYKTIGGTTVGTIGSALCGINPPTIAFSDPIIGFDTTTNNRAYGQSGNAGNANTACNGSFGDTKGLDLWTYSPSSSASTTVNIVTSTMLGVAKAAGTVVNHNNGTYTVPYTVTLQNYGAEALKNIQITDDLLTTFAPLGATSISTSAPVVVITNTGTGASPTSLTSSGTGFTGKGGSTNGGGANNLLTGGATSILATGAIATVTFNVTFQPGTNIATTFNNTVIASGNSILSGQSVTDNSANGIDPDNTPGGGVANNDNNPTNNTSPTPITLTGLNIPNLRLVKRVSAINVKQTDETFVRTAITSFNDLLVGAGVNDDNAPGWPITPPIYLQGAFDQAQVPVAIQPRPGDQVEYTIYFLSDGPANAQNVTLCDFVPNNSSYVANSLQLQIGTAPITAVADTVGASGGAYAVAPFPSACNGTDNGNGAVLVNIGTVANSTGAGVPATSYGYIRFLATVN
jgi:uncharacterized repeat protein (TIGR01451 family)